MEPVYTNKRSLSFGRYLKTVRLERGIRLEQISITTRIGIDNLLAIEKEDHDRLPAEVFVKGFIRAYARSVGADADEAVRLYMASRSALQETVQIEADLIKSSIHFWPRLLMSLGGVFCIMMISILAMSQLSLSAGEKVGSKSETAAQSAPPVPSVFSVQEALTENPSPDTEPEKLLLKIRSVEKTWLKVTIDDQQSREYILNPSDRLELEARSGFNLLIGNAAGVRLTLNDNDLSISGKKGQVVNLKIP